MRSAHELNNHLVSCTDIKGVSKAHFNSLIEIHVRDHNDLRNFVIFRVETEVTAVVRYLDRYLLII